jgi:hypothetical protein
LEVSDPSVLGKKIVIRSMPLMALFFVVFLGYMAFIYSAAGTSLQMAYILMMVFSVSLVLVFFLIIQSGLGRNYQRITFYDGGVQFPNYLWDRMRGMEPFLERSKIASVKASFITTPNVVNTNTAELVFQTIAGKTYHTGYRVNSDINSTSDWLEKEWQLKVERSDSRGGPVVIQQGAPAAPVSGNGLRTCVGCGYSFEERLGFCPSCGKFVARKEDQLDMFAPEKTPERAKAQPVQPVPEEIHRQNPPPSVQPVPVQQSPAPQPQAMVQQSYQPPAQPQYYQPYQNQYAPGAPQPNYDPRYQAPYAGQGYPPPQYSNPYYQNQYQPVQDPSGKSPRMAKLLAGFGLLGFMGIGHFYMGKYIKGIILFISGGFLAMMSLLSIIMASDSRQYYLAASIVVAALFTVPFLILFVWQLNDAPKPKVKDDVKDQSNYYHPPNGP